MHSFTATDTLVKGMLLGMLLEMALLWTVYIGVATSKVHLVSEAVDSIVCSILITLTLILWRPLMMKTFWKDRFPFVLAQDLGASIIGRLAGTALGVAFGVYTLDLLD